MMITAETVLNVAKAELGYYEKKDASRLDSKTDHVGSNNYTKYSRDLYAAGFYNGNKQGHAWCVQFVDWCFFTACGGNKEKAEALLCQTGNLGAGVGYSARYYQNQGRFFERDPQPGDQIFFNKDGIWTHTGLVLEVKNGKVYTIEGNKNNHVAKCVYPLNYATIKGYGRPDYSQTVQVYTLPQFIREVQQSCGAKVDGIAGPETIGKTVTLSAAKNQRHPAVKPVQKYLVALGYSQVGEADGIAGPKFTAAVKEFQRVNRCWVDGEITAANKTWRKLLGME